ncbi:sulfite exporter TauE/SafE family protein (plasmid) [Nicoliella spurrieriana]|uniref:Probable membrane transporter protein n=1 Tax=Nicoliella spurrieriana TaxID=2925830 RepID=A0A976X4N3_9LACO|nr:sulfite exporter TauE/SafE family protein [Nicoliella spurrieriana]UQS85995.1 sulfite exporter TauE/SafE family protein [Nicoliella spurrieriana]
MHFDISQLLLLFPFGFLAGIVSSTVGMASLVSYPALLYVAGLPPVYANVTNTSSVIFNGIGSGLSSIPELKGHVKQLITTSIFILIGSVSGTYFLLHFSSGSFTKLVPFFILFAALTMVWPSKKNGPKKQVDSKLGQWLYSIAILLAGIYVGYFGAASGIIVNAILSKITHEKYAVYNAIRNVSSFCGNLVAMIIYSFQSHVYWILVLPLGSGLLIGAYIGPKIVRVVPEAVIKWIVAILAFGLAIELFIQAY